MKKPSSQPAEAPQAGTESLAILEKFLRRLPRVIRQLRVRQEDRPPFRVNDERDLEDLLRSLLPLYFDDVRPESRSVSYASASNTDFWITLESEAMVLMVKRVRTNVGEQQVGAQIKEDVDYYEALGELRTLMCFIHDPAGILQEPRQLEERWSGLRDGLTVRCVIVS